MKKNRLSWAAPAALMVFSALWLSGCTGMMPHDKAPAVYDFGQPRPVSAENAENAGTRRLAERLALDVRAAPWLSGPEIDYRLTYAGPLERSQYADSRWAAPPALLLAAQLRRQIGFAAVDSVASDCVLRVELQEFSQVFTEPQSSQGVLQGQISLIDGKRRLIAGRAVAIERPAPSSNAAGGVRALVEAGDELGRQLADWLNRLNREGELKSCGLDALFGNP